MSELEHTCTHSPRFTEQTCTHSPRFTASQHRWSTNSIHASLTLHLLIIIYYFQQKISASGQSDLKIFWPNFQNQYYNLYTNENFHFHVGMENNNISLTSEFKIYNNIIWCMTYKSTFVLLTLFLFIWQVITCIFNCICFLDWLENNTDIKLFTIHVFIVLGVP